MANYKGLTFSTTIEGFRNWLKAFPSIMSSDVRASEQYLKDGYYIEINCLRVREFGNNPTFVWTLRRFNWEDKDYSIHLNTEEEKEIIASLFADEVKEFCTKHKMSRGF